MHAAPEIARTAYSCLLLRMRTLCCFAASLLVCAAGVTTAANAQAAHFAGVLTTLESSATYPDSVAVGSDGSVYIAESSSSDILKETPAGSGYTETRILIGFAQITGIAVDSSGNLYVSSSSGPSGQGGVVKETPSGGAYSQSLVDDGNLTDPRGITVDGSGNVYIAAGTQQFVAKATPNGSGYTLSYLGTNLTNPIGVAVDSSGNIYVADSGNGQIFLEALSAGNYSESVIASGLTSPSAIAIDSSGALYVADQANNTILKETPVGGVYNQTTVVSNLYSPAGAAVDGKGNLYVADLGSQRTIKVQFAGTNLGSLPIGTASPVATFSFIFDAAGALGDLPKVLTQGAENLDFADAGTGTCTTNGSSYYYAAGDACTVDVVFKPRFPGTRSGAVTLFDSSGNSLAIAYTSGVGVGPQLTFGPTNRTIITADIGAPQGVAVDAAGNIYIADYQNNSILRQTLSAGSIGEVTIGNGLSHPIGVATDGAGNVYIADCGSSRVLKETAALTGYTQSVVASDLSCPHGVAVDGVGNLYITDTSTHRLLKETLSGNAYIESVIDTGLTFPWGVAVDGDGNVYVADQGSNALFKETLANGAYTRSTLDSNLAQPSGLAIDGFGNLYVAIGNGSQITKESLSSGGYTPAVVSTGLQSANGISVNQAGDIYVSELDAHSVSSLNLSSPPALNFAQTRAGATSSDSPQTVTLTNSGNADLTFTIPISGLNPGIDAGFTFDNSSTCPQLSASSTAATLAPGASCTELVKFIPQQGGTYSGLLSISDNNLNTLPVAVQAISLTGIATQSPQTITFPQLSAPITYGAAPKQLSASASSGLPITYTLGAGPATLIGSSLTFTGAGTISVTASQTGNSAFEAAIPVTITFTVSPAILMATASNLTKVYGAGNPVLTGSYSGAVSADTFQETYQTIADQYTRAGVYDITPTITGTNLSNYTVVTQKGTLTITPAPLNIFAVNVSRSYGAPNPTLPGTYNGQQGGDEFQVKGITAAARTTPVGTYSIIPTVTGANLPSYTVTAVNGTMTINPAPTQLTLNSSANTGSNPDPVTLYAGVKSKTSGIPTGTVTFSSGGTVLGTGTLDPTGAATLSATLAAGDNTVTAAYSASGNFAASSDTETVTVVAPASAAYSVSAKDGALTLAQGSTAATTLTLQPVSGYTGSVALSCQNLPDYAQCIFSQNPVTLKGDNQAVSINLTITTHVEQTRLRFLPSPSQGTFNPVFPALGFWWPQCFIGLALFNRKRSTSKTGRRPGHVALLVLSIAALGAGLSGCGGGGSPKVAPSGTANVKVVATGTSGTNVTTQSTLLTVTITP